MKKSITFIFLTMTLILLSQISTIYAQKARKQLKKCEQSPNDYSIDILPGKYDGRYLILQTSPKQCEVINAYCNKTPKFKAGKYVLIIGWDGENIPFDVNENGNIENVENKIAINTKNPRNSKTLEFNNVEISINPGQFKDKYCLGQYRGMEKPCEKKPKYTVVPNLSYELLLYGEDNDEIVFHVDEDKDKKVKISCVRNGYAASGDGDTLELKNNLIEVTSNHKDEITFGIQKIKIPSQVVIVPHIAVPISYKDSNKGSKKYVLKMHRDFIPEELVFSRKSFWHRHLKIKFRCLDCPPKS